MLVNSNVEPYAQKGITLSFLVDRIRGFMRDRTQLNRLIAGVENSDEDIMHAIDLCISDFNSSPPFIGSYKFANPPPYHLLIMGAVIFLLQSKGLLESRNALSFNDGGIAISADKDSRTMQWIQNFMAKYEADKLQFKKSANIEAAWGVSLSSEYIIVNNLSWFSIYS
jgi:hypothetical protein